MMNLDKMSNRCTAVQMAFCGSILLSVLALLNTPTINRDGILYVETARVFLQDGFFAAFHSFDWPFLSILMGGISRLTGVEIETTGQILNALFMAGACALLVSSTKRTAPEAVWWVCLVILTLVGINRYREELLREYGCWFFTMLSFWIALRWSEAPRWTSALAAQIGLGFASLFRPEALAFFAAMFMWQLFDPRKEGRLRRVLMVSCLPLAGLIVLLGLFLAGQFELSGRLGSVLRHFDPTIKTALFDAKAQALSAALIPYARDQAGTVLFMGSLAIIPLKFIRQLGLFIVPLLFLLQSRGLRSAIARAPLFAWGFLAHLVVLSAFVVDMQFLSGRYVAVLSLLAAPFVGIGLWQMMQSFPRWKYVTLVVSVLLMLSNVVSLHPGQNYFARAGEWLAANTAESLRVYVEGTRTAYYAGWNTRKAFAKEDRAQLSNLLQQEKYDLVVLEVSHQDDDIDAWLADNNLRLEKRFRNSRNDSIVVAVSNKTVP